MERKDLILVGFIYFFSYLKVLYILYHVPPPHLFFFDRDAPEATGDEPEDADFEMPKIYEPVSIAFTGSTNFPSQFATYS